MSVTFKKPTKLVLPLLASAPLTAERLSRGNFTEMPQAPPASLGVFTTALKIPLFLKKLAKKRVSFRDLKTAIAYCIFPPIYAHKPLFNTIFITKKESDNK